MSAARNWRARSSARGNWLDCTPTRPTNPDPAAHVDDGIALVACLDVDLNIGPEHLGVRAFPQQAVHARKAVGGNARPPPLDDIAVVVVMRRFDQDDLELTASHRAPLVPRTKTVRDQNSRKQHCSQAQVPAPALRPTRLAPR